MLQRRLATAHLPSLQFHKHTHSPTFLTTYITTAWRGWYLTLFWCTNTAVTDKRSWEAVEWLRLQCLILLITYVAIVHGEVCINRPLFWNTHMEPWNSDAWGVFVHTPQRHSEIRHFVTQKPPAPSLFCSSYQTVAKEPFHLMLEDLWRFFHCPQQNCKALFSPLIGQIENLFCTLTGKKGN